METESNCSEKWEEGNDCPISNNTITCLWLCAKKSSAIPVKTVEPIGRLKVILFNPGIQSRIMSDIKIASLLTEKYLYLLLRKIVRYL